MTSVKAYKAGNSLRVTVPKAIYETFAKLSEQAGASPVPCLVLRVRYEDEIVRDVPYFSNCDFGLELYLWQDCMYASDLRLFGETSVGFIISKPLAMRLALVEGTKLECSVLENTRPSDGFYSKIIGYSIKR